jgi:hypothetical protein
MLKYLFPVALLLLGCNGTSQESGQATVVAGQEESSGGGVTAPAGGGLLVMSTATAAEISPDDLCKVPFPNSATLYPVTDQPDKRYFSISEGKTYVVVLTAGNSRTSFMVQQKGDKLHVLTSAQYPYCLSNAAHFQMQDNGNTFHYDGGKYTTFFFTAIPDGTGFRGELSWNPGMVLGIYCRVR